MKKFHMLFILPVLTLAVLAIASLSADAQAPAPPAGQGAAPQGAPPAPGGQPPAVGPQQGGPGGPPAQLTPEQKEQRRSLLADYFLKRRALHEDLSDQHLLYQAYVGNNNANVSDIQAVVAKMRSIRDSLYQLYDNLRGDLAKNNLGAPKFPPMMDHFRYGGYGHDGGGMHRGDGSYSRDKRFESPFGENRHGPDQRWGRGHNSGMGDNDRGQGGRHSRDGYNDDRGDGYRDRDDDYRDRDGRRHDRGQGGYDDRGRGYNN
jgi:Spy/CpxP family protein refolding chaperone